ncbi:tRNA (guanine(10)-N(2))-dimethyltransferase [Archaeoglobales archaeon]|nr:MAG: tRNA (guanine(10)-N(2))-dimethyltransferase [Archaeoglobales archaeon]
MERVSEGKAIIEVEEGVFYNPKMRFCRDFDIAVFREIKRMEGEVNYLDALAGTGIRGIRAFLEANFNPTFNDSSKKAVENIRRNLELNDLEADVFSKDANILMRERFFFHIDIDPFGSPASFIDSAVIKPKYLSITATDTAALCGSATKSGMRKYSSYVLKTEYYPEVGLRVLLGRILSESGKYDKAPEVLIAFAKEHFYRVHVRFKRSPRAVRNAYRKYGFILHCFNCLRRYTVPMGEEFEGTCECGKKFSLIGPLWLGELHSQEFVERIAEDDLGEEVGRVVGVIKEENNTPLFYDLHFLTKKMRMSPPLLDGVIESLKEIGFMASRTRFLGTSFKTNAPIEEIYKVIKSMKN